MATGYKNSLLFDFLRVAYTEYWRKHKIIIDYFLLDYLILIAYDNFDLVKEAIDAVKPNNLAIKDLVDNLNKPFDEIKWEEIKKDTCLYKLSWKMNVYDQVEGRKTFYYKIVKGEE